MAVRGTGSVFVHIDQNAVANLARSAGPVDVYTKGKANQVATAARRLVPVKTGALRNSIKVQQARDLKGRYSVSYDVEAGAKYAAFVHEGTRPHVITGNPLLVFQVAGTTVFARKVNHPGTKANPFLVRATQAVIGRTR